MKRRAWRITIGAAALVAVLLALLVVANWGTVRDHVEAWHFQLTTETETLDPKTAPLVYDNGLISGLQILSAHSNLSVIYDHEGGFWDEGPWVSTFTVHQIVHVLRDAGYRVLEQRFPQRAYVVIRGTR